MLATLAARRGEVLTATALSGAAARSAGVKNESVSCKAVREVN